jgi:uncharacterized membrane protein YgaE (UPF0421/DUF939 family)
VPGATGFRRSGRGPAWTREGVRERLHRVRLDATFALQSGLAAGAAWFVAREFVGHDQPFFAPIAAVIVLSASSGLRWRRTLELVGGVALGIALADALIVLAGVGTVQIVVVVTIAILITVFFGGGNLAVAQAASSAVLVVALTPREGDLNLDRLVDALVGGTVGLAVMALVLPQNPLTRVQRAAGAALNQLAESLALTARGLRERDAGAPRRALADLRATEGQYLDLADVLTIGQESATLSPLRWRMRPALARYRRARVHLERASRNVRVLARRSAAVVLQGEPVPDELPQALDTLAGAVRALRDELAAQREPTKAREQALVAVRTAGEAYRAGVGFSGSAVVAQLRGAVVDLLRATGVTEERADRLVDAASRDEP